MSLISLEQNLASAVKNSNSLMEEEIKSQSEGTEDTPSVIQYLLEGFEQHDDSYQLEIVALLLMSSHAQIVLDFLTEYESVSEPERSDDQMYLAELFSDAVRLKQLLDLPVSEAIQYFSSQLVTAFEAHRMRQAWLRAKYELQYGENEWEPHSRITEKPATIIITDLFKLMAEIDQALTALQPTMPDITYQLLKHEFEEIALDHIESKLMGYKKSFYEAVVTLGSQNKSDT